jgi:esterase/lipase superfamily enzyme
MKSLRRFVIYFVPVALTGVISIGFVKSSPSDYWPLAAVLITSAIIIGAIAYLRSHERGQDDYKPELADNLWSMLTSIAFSVALATTLQNVELKKKNDESHVTIVQRQLEARSSIVENPNVKGYRHVYFATDREPLGDQHFNGYALESGELQFGEALVSIPKLHELGELERPLSMLSLTLPEDSSEHIVIAKRYEFDESDFYNAINKAIDSADDHSAFVFVHGYNVSFDDAILRTGQLAWDLHFKGPAIAYSWPSQARLSQYATDHDMADWTAPHLAAFLHSLRGKTGVRTVHLVAHSMGTRAISMALARLADEKTATPKFQEVILAAPDINRLVFGQLAAGLRDESERVTIYSSQKDWALRFSAFVRNRQKRVGGAASALPNFPFDIIDATKARASLLGHSYFAQDHELLEDISLLLRQRLKPGDRSITLEEEPPIWVFHP